MSVHVTAEHLRLANRLVAKAHRAGGLAPLDLARFWADDERAHKDPFAPDCPQVPLGIRMGLECVFAELGIPADWHRLYHDPAWGLDLARRYNDRAEQIVGRRVLAERPLPPADRQYPRVKELWEIFAARNEWHSASMSYWLFPAANDEAELCALLDRVEKRLEDLRAFMLPPTWAQEAARLAGLGVKPPLYRGQRGPVTFAMSVYGVEKLIFLLVDNPGLAGRFRDVILRAILERARILDEEAGYRLETAPHGWGWADDNCAMLSAGLYEFFGWPILEAVFARYSPAPGDSRYQHSDSDMGHLLPALGRLDLTGVNFGPNVMPADIRRHLPRAVIHGQLAPFTFSRNEEANMVAEFLRDVGMVRPGKGLVFTTAGSINNGSRLAGMRLLMAAIQEHGRY